MYPFDVPYRRSGFSRDAFEFAAKAAPTTPIIRHVFDKWYFGNYPFAYGVSVPKSCK